MRTAHVDRSQEADRRARPRFATLLVHPEPGARRIHAHALSRAGYHVAEAAGGPDALARIRGFRPQVVVIDLAPGGIDLCRRIRARADFGNPYVILLLPREELGRLFDVFLAGADDHLVTPAPPWALLAKVARGERVLRAPERRFP